MYFAKFLTRAGLRISSEKRLALEILKREEDPKERVSGKEGRKEIAVA
jgi:hypothetical protein